MGAPKKYFSNSPPLARLELIGRANFQFLSFQIEQRLAALRKDARTIPIDHKWSWQIKAEEEKRKEEEEMEKWVSDEFITFSSLIEATVPGRINYFQQNGSEEFAIIFSNI